LRDAGDYAGPTAAASRTAPAAGGPKTTHAVRVRSSTAKAAAAIHSVIQTASRVEPKLLGPDRGYLSFTVQRADRCSPRQFVRKRPFLTQA